MDQGLGLSPEEIDYLGKTGAGVAKASRRDLPILVAQGRDADLQKYMNLRWIKG